MYWSHSETVLQYHLVLGWCAISLGIISGALIGMFFHREGWLGGYGSPARRMLRLGHIAFFGMAFLNFAFAGTLFVTHAQSTLVGLASLSLLLATISMPAVCFVSARYGISRAAFTIPVLGTVALVACTLQILLDFPY